MNKRGFAALCARADFGAPHYIVLRMALDLAEQACDRGDAETACASETIASVQQEYDQIRGDRAQMPTWFAS
jgi:hypothetical protein